MPNGDDGGWVRFCGAADGFRMRYGRWPARARLAPGLIELFEEHFFTRRDFNKLKKKIRLVADGRVFIVVEDDSFPSEGETYDYEANGFPDERPTPSAEEWFGIKVRTSDPRP